MNRIDSNFLSRGIRCAGWLYLPDEVSNPPVVIMAHGFAGERIFRLPAFAEKFCSYGLAVFLFDYRNFGDSDGEPRNLVSPKRQLEDWQSAIEHIRSLRMIDASRIALWGTSFSGGHILVTSAKNPNISAVVAQVPFVGDRESLRKIKPKFALFGILHGLRDLFQTLLLHQPHYVPVVAEPEKFAVMNTPEAKPGYLSLIPPDFKWENKVPGRIFINIPFYQPYKFAQKITCPVLIVYAEEDSLIPSRAIEKTASRIKNVKLVKLPCGHFDVYTGEYFEKVSNLEVEFLIQYLTHR